jgi:hypothetical protein
VRIANDTWIVSTGQGWKVGVFLIMMAAAGLGFVIFFILLSLRALSDETLTLLGVMSTMIGSLSMVWFFLSIRCRACGRRPVWTLVNNSEVSAWWIQLIRSEDCPICHDRPRSPLARG